jgi:hypothetical protein
MLTYIIYPILAIVVLILIFKRIEEKKSEDFENRDN